MARGRRGRSQCAREPQSGRWFVVSRCKGESGRAEEQDKVDIFCLHACMARQLFGGSVTCAMGEGLVRGIVL
ncbi:hypothetical protein E2C01_055503 [Portunus trituberculatus]|uniref:Uncharacterized protein n=1 Tax=Portunus trituberculatus TaxID=210409 RepID=A0A5B7GMW6_PORTR|nr:hypothetical protein [Portunus trituberculatus]